MKKWIENNGCYELHFEPYYGDEIILNFCVDINNSERFWYCSDILKVEDDYIICDSVEEAKEEFEQMILDYYVEQAKYYDDLSNKFEDD